MKNALISISLVLICHYTQAQILKGSIAASASLSFYSQHRIDPRYTNVTYKSYTTNYSINPTLGYFLADNLVLGLGTTYTYSKSNEIQDYDTVATSDKINSQYLQVASYLGYYIKLSDKAYFSLTGSVGYRFTLFYRRTSTLLEEDKEDKSYEIKANLTPGILYFINEKFALQATVGSLYYTYTREKDFTQCLL